MYGIKKLLFMGSSCIYPKNAPQPLKEDYLLSGKLEETNEPYAIAKIAGIKMCESYFKQYGCDFISIMPTNLYGPNDNYDLEKSHVLPALIRKFHLSKCLESGEWDEIRDDLNKNSIEGVSGISSEAEILEILKKQGIKHSKTTESSKTGISANVTLWGSGHVFREFLHVDDMADASVYLMENLTSQKLYNDLNVSHINIGTGVDLTILELAEMVKEVVGFSGPILWDTRKPDGTYKKLLDVSLLNSLGWVPKIALKEGIKRIYENYKIS